jgi:hypothetical protein
MKHSTLHKILSHPVILAGLALLTCSFSATAADLHVGSGQTYATITAAQTAAVAGDRIVVHTGTYDEAPTGGGGINGWSWNKDVDIVAAAGEHPIMTSTPTAFSYCMFSMTGGTSVSLRVWDGIDFKISQYNYSRGEFCVFGYAGTTTFKNVKIYDTGAATNSVGAMYYLDSGPVKMNLENVTIDCEQAAIFGLHIDAGTGSLINITGCNFNGRINGAVLSRGGFGHRVNINNTTFNQTRGPYPAGVFVRQATGSITATNCRFIVAAPGYGGIYDTIAWGAAGLSGPTSATLTRCLFDTRLGGNQAITMGSTEAGGNSINVVNGVFLDNNAVGTPGAVATAAAAAPTTMQFDHCTFSNVTPAADLCSIKINSDNSNPMTLILRNNLFHLPESTTGAVVSTNGDGSLGGTLNLTAGKNLRWTAGFAVGAQEKLTGTIITGDPVLQADLYHLGGITSAALAQGIPVGITNDYEGDARPLPVGTNPDLGADETAAVVVNGAGHWALY